MADIPALGRIASAPRLLVALDFDGALAPLVDRPEDARPLPEAVAAINRLRAEPGVRVALISGRAIESLTEVASPAEDVLLAGSHGVELRLDGGERVLLANDAERAALRQLTAVLDEAVAGRDGLWLEHKPAGIALHSRAASEEDTEAGYRLARAGMVGALAGTTVRDGKNVLEFSVVATTKGDALRRLRELVAADAVFYAGDDVTDEDAFAVLGPPDLGVKVGAGETAATARVSDPAQLAELLGELATLRAAGGSYRQ